MINRINRQWRSANCVLMYTFHRRLREERPARRVEVNQIDSRF
jgi:hypothetical protein